MSESISCNQYSRFEWKVKNVLLVKDMESDDFIITKHRWRLLLGVDIEDDITLTLCLMSSKPLVGKYRVEAFAEVPSKRKKVKTVKYHECILDNPKFVHEMIWWYSKQQIQDLLYQTDGFLTFVTIISTLPADGDHGKGKSSQTPISMDNVICLESLSHDFQQLMADGAHQSDVTLLCEERSVPAHKLILSARSKVFSAIFQSEMADSRSGVIEITDMDTTLLDEFLRFIYTGKLSGLSFDTATKLYAAANKYCVNSLKNFCKKFMIENMTRENACELLVLADAHEEKYLKNTVLDFIMNIQLLQNDDIWLKFLEEHPKLATEVIHKAYKAICVPNTH